MASLDLKTILSIIRPQIGEKMYEDLKLNINELVNDYNDLLEENKGLMASNEGNEDSDSSESSIEEYNPPEIEEFDLNNPDYPDLESDQEPTRSIEFNCPGDLHPLDREYESVEEMIKVFNVDPVKFRSFIISLELQLRNGRKLEYGLGLMTDYRDYLEKEKEYGRYCDYLE